MREGFREGIIVHGGIYMTTAFSTQGFQDLLAFPFRTPEDKRKLLLGSVLGVARFIIPVAADLVPAWIWGPDHAPDDPGQGRTTHARMEGLERNVVARLENWRRMFSLWVSRYRIVDAELLWHDGTGIAGCLCRSCRAGEYPYTFRASSPRHVCRNGRLWPCDASWAWRWAS